jgi:nucleoside-diphosphate-sugar epimerase
LWLPAEDELRGSGVPFAIVRPVALTEEPGGMPLKFDQGDTMRGKVSREDVAELCVALLDQPAAVNTTFEVGSTVPFSQPWTGKLLQEPVLQVALLSRQEGASVLDL